MKRQLAPSPFASPVLKHPCTTRHDTEDTDPPPSASTETHSPPPSPHHTLHSPSSLTETSDDEVADPLSVADLCTMTSDLTGVTSTACTGYLNALCLEDSEAGDTLGVGPDGRMPHPLHSTAAHLGLTHLSNWQQTPVRVPLADSHIRNQQHGIQTGDVPHANALTSGIGINHSPGIDSGVGVSTELSSEHVKTNTLSSLGHTPSSQTTPTTVSSAVPAKVGVSLTPGKKPPAILHSLLPFRLNRDLQTYHHLGALPPVLPYATPTLQTTPTQQQATPTSSSLPRHSVCPASAQKSGAVSGVSGITRTSRSLHNTPRR